MVDRIRCEEAARRFKVAQGVDLSDENAVAAFHLMNTHGVDTATALDQSSRSAGDHGIDTWYYSEEDDQLYIYQSKLSEQKSLVLKGLSDLLAAGHWLSDLLERGELERRPTGNHCLYNLFLKLGEKQKVLMRIEFVLISPFEEDELEDLPEFEAAQRELSGLALNKMLRQRHGGIDLVLRPFNLVAGLPDTRKRYKVDRIPHSTIQLRKNAHLDLAYVPLFTLIGLFRQRGTILFDKNVRLSLYNMKDAKDRLVHPMESTLEAIVTGELDPSIFPFYHVGVTIFSPQKTEEGQELLSLEAPSIINGCQTITIGNEFLRRLETKNDAVMISRFKEIKVVAKLVVGVSGDELREITNSNNRQAPIENWQLFSNEPIHIEIEAALKSCGIFYERQSGKFDALMKNLVSASAYFNTNGAFVKVETLGQLVCMARWNAAWSAKPSEIFLNVSNHKKVFDKEITRHPRDIVFLHNLLKSVKTGLNRYLEIPAHANDYTQRIYKKPMIRAYAYCLAMRYYYQKKEKAQIRSDYSVKLLKIASPSLNEELQSFYMKIVTRIKGWYLEQSKNLTLDISQRKLEAFMYSLQVELGIDVDGPLPFSGTAHEWVEG